MKKYLCVLLLSINTFTYANLNEGIAAYDQADYSTALMQFRPLAEQGNAKAQYHLGVMYHNGQGMIPNETQAIYWLKKAAEQDDVLAQSLLGIIYHNQRHSTKDDPQILYWYKKAALQGDIDAQYNLAWMYKKGQGVTQNYKIAYILMALVTQRPVIELTPDDRKIMLKNQNEVFNQLSPNDRTDAEHIIQQLEKSKNFAVDLQHLLDTHP